MKFFFSCLGALYEQAKTPACCSRGSHQSICPHTGRSQPGPPGLDTSGSPSRIWSLDLGLWPSVGPVSGSWHWAHELASQAWGTLQLTAFGILGLTFVVSEGLGSFSVCAHGLGLFACIFFRPCHALSQHARSSGNWDPHRDFHLCDQSILRPFLCHFGDGCVVRFLLSAMSAP
jgi:hypothetical protein